MNRSGNIAALLLVALAVADTAIEAGLPGHAMAPATAMTLDINVAEAADLTLLPGIGPQLARRIFEHRRAHGPFRSLQDLQRVPGIGPRTVQRASGYARVVYDSSN
jgi:competence protein ComEA